MCVAPPSCKRLLLSLSLLPSSTTVPSLSSKFTEKAKFTTTGRPLGAMTVLSPSAVAVPMHTPAQIEIWDWWAGKRVKTLTGFGEGYVFANALLPDGRLVAGNCSSDWTGTLRVGLPDNWAAAR